jgi:hypothetical protein
MNGAAFTTQRDIALTNSANKGVTAMSNSLPVNVRQTPQPPSLHWAIVLVLSILTFGLFSFFWAFRQALFAKKIDPKNMAPLQVAASFALVLFSFLLGFVNALTVSRGGEASSLGSTGLVVSLFQLFMFISAALQIRKTLTAYYGIRMNAFLTMLFNVYYVQFHMSQIVKIQLPGPGQQGSVVLPVSSVANAGD